jgi:hypothetical protein
MKEQTYLATLESEQTTLSPPSTNIHFIQTQNTRTDDLVIAANTLPPLSRVQVCCLRKKYCVVWQRPFYAGLLS